MPLFLLALLLAGVVSYGLSIVVQQKAVQLGLVKPPNERSSHVIPTARGGGVGIAVAGTLASGILALYGAPILAVVCALGAAIAVTGFIDDLREVPVSVRLCVQAVVVAVMVVSVPVFVGGSPQMNGWIQLAAIAVTVIAGIWWINAFNFMDGIDGIAASQASLVFVGVLLLWRHGNSSAASDPVFGCMMLVAAATAGFLLRNWPPAKVFMGDVGSTYLGFVLFAFFCITVASGALTLLTWVIMLAVFASDSGMTVVRRTFRGERPWRAHRRHAYQQLSRKWGHRPVTLLFAALTAFWAFPLAWVSIAFPAAAIWWALLAYLPLLIGFYWAGAGAREEI